MQAQDDMHRRSVYAPGHLPPLSILQYQTEQVLELFVKGAFGTKDF
jgi:hypothetical protein